MNPAMRILLVDDDGSVLAGLRNVLRPTRHRWELRVAETPESALEELARQPADVVVSDVRMPGMDGIELLGRVLATWPATVRVLLSGWSDPGSISRAGAVAHRYLLKPCESDTLRAELAAIEEALALLPDPALRATLGSLRSLPASPAALQALRSLPDAPQDRTRSVAEVVESDVALATRVLQFASSPSFGPPRPVTGLRAALALVSPALVRQMAALLEPLAPSAQLPGALGSLDRLERHARQAARAARVAGATLDDEGADAAATAALLHDAGRLAILSRLPERYLEIVRAAGPSGRTLEEAEVEVLGATHARIGAYLLGLWGLPRVVVDAVARHHDPGALDDPGLPGLVARANLLAHQAETSSPAAPTPQPPRSPT